MTDHKAESGTLAVKNQEISNRIAVWRGQAEALVVSNSEDYAATLAFLKELRTYKKAVGFEKDPGIHSAKQHLDFLREDKAKHIRPIDEIDKAVSTRASAWREQERRAAEVEQEKLNADRRRVAAAEAERVRIAAEKEAARLEQERKKEIEKARKAGEFGKRDANRLAKEAEAQAARDKEQARIDAEAAAQVKAVKVKPSIPKMAGIKGRTNWKFKVVHDHLIPRGYLMPDEVAIGAMVRNRKDKAYAEAACPGIEVWSEDSV